MKRGSPRITAVSWIHSLVWMSTEMVETSIECILMSFHLHSMFVYKVRTCSRLGVRMVCCITAWTPCQRFLGNRKWATRQITSSKPSIPSPRPLTCRRYTCTRRKWTAQVSPLHASVCCVCVSLRLRGVCHCSLFSGFRKGYPYPHAHTLYFQGAGDVNCKLLPEQFRAKMVMFAFGNALARAHSLYGVRNYSSRLTADLW